MTSATVVEPAGNCHLPGSCLSEQLPPALHLAKSRRPPRDNDQPVGRNGTVPDGFYLFVPALEPKTSP